jgi:hypothetical protein
MQKEEREIKIITLKGNVRGMAVGCGTSYCNLCIAEASGVLMGGSNLPPSTEIPTF